MSGSGTSLRPLESVILRLRDQVCQLQRSQSVWVRSRGRSGGSLRWSRSRKAGPYYQSATGKRPLQVERSRPSVGRTVSGLPDRPVYLTGPDAFPAHRRRSSAWATTSCRSRRLRWSNNGPPPSMLPMEEPPPASARTADKQIVGVPSRCLAWSRSRRVKTYRRRRCRS